jgi:polysaccharide deacetylase family protein (PEP-CTERM system associated)
MLNALSVDVEDWFQVGAFENVIARESWDSLPRRVERNSDKVLELFDRAGVKATFFTLGWVAQRHPALVRRIVEAGHEIASHGWDHVRVFTMSPAVFRADLERARIAIEATGLQASRSISARPGPIGSSPRKVMPILRASRPSATTIMAGGRRRALPSGRSKDRI